MKTTTRYQPFLLRKVFVLGILCLMAVLLASRALQLQVINSEKLQTQGDARYMRVVTTPAHRGMITDRNGEPLAISTPVDSIWANPQKLVSATEKWPGLAKALNMSVADLRSRAQRADKEFVYLKRHVNPALAQKVLALQVPGVYLQRESRRFYPMGEVAAHLVGFTNVDDAGQEGVELGYNRLLAGVPGAKRIIQDRFRQVVEDVESIKEPVPGRDIALSIDQRIQYLAYRELLAAVKAHKSSAGSAVIIDVQTGEVLAAVNQPAFNPNMRTGVKSSRYRNRTVTDVFEPGSTVKPFVVAAALEARKIQPNTLIDTRPGFFRVGGITVRDIHNYGLIDVSTVLQKSSNIGVTKIAMSIDTEHLWGMFRRLGFGQNTGSGFPGEQRGIMRDHRHWRESERASFSFGYGLSGTALQLARAYAALGNDGVLQPVSFQRLDVPPAGERVIKSAVSAQVLNMMETVTNEGGTGMLARVPGYRVAGKTGTVHKLSGNSYAKDRYLALFAGLVPASKPRLAMVVIIDDPKSKEYYGGQVAAPMFSQTMAGALRLLNVPPDDPSSLTVRIASSGKSNPKSVPDKVAWRLPLAGGPL